MAIDFKKRYATDALRLHKLLASKFDTFSQKHLRFELFSLPFKSVQEFRDAFNQLVL